MAAADPWLGVLAADGATRWAQGPRQIDPRGQKSNLAVSPDGMLVEFGLRYGGENRRRFDLATPKLLLPADDNRVAPPVQEGLPIAGWEETYVPTLDGRPLPLMPREASHSLAVHPMAGGSCSVPSGRCAPLTRPAPRSGIARRVGLSGRLISAARAGSRSPPMATARSAGTGWRTAPSC